MIIGIGNDIIEQSRVKRACERAAFLTRVYTKKEQKLIEADRQKAAGNWAIKEAVSKVLGRGFAGIEPVEIEVLREDSGRPYVTLYGKAEACARRLGITRLHVSLSHTGDYVCAFAVGEGEPAKRQEAAYGQRADSRDGQEEESCGI